MMIIITKTVVFVTRSYWWKKPVRFIDTDLFFGTIKDIYKALYQFEKTFAEVHDITINEAMLLCCLKDGETKSAGMICEYIGLSNSRVSKVITAVENKGYIRRNINKNDKRQMCFSLTPGGKEKIQQMMNAELCFDGLFEKLKTCMEKG